MAQHSLFAGLHCQAFATDMSGLHSKLGFKVGELKPKSGVKPVQGSSIPLILPNDLKYNPSTGRVEKVQGVQRQWNGLHVVPEALELLEGIEEPVSVLAICGPCRSGKSYILSRLLGTSDAFELGHRMDPQTFGIWMGTKVLRGKDFTIVLLDTEGMDTAGASADQDARILVLTVLLSSRLIYNSLFVPYKRDLEKMQCFIKLAKGIIVNKGERTQMSVFREFFPDFLWLLRDVSPKLTDHNGVEIDPSEYLKTRVLGRQAEDYYDESTSDKVGRAILTFFPSVECAILERPSNDTEILNNIAHHTDRLNPGFNKGVDNLTERLLLKACAKRGYDRGSTVNGVALSIMAKQYVEAVNDPNAIPALDNTWRNTIELMENRAIEEAVTEYNMQMQAQIARATNNGRVPLEENTGIERIRDPDQVALMDLHNEVLHDVTEMLLERVRHLGISSGDVANENKVLVDQMQKRLVQREECTVEYVAADGTTRKQEGFVVTGGELLQYIQQNKQLSKLFCQTLFARLFDPIRKHSESPPPDFDLQALIEERDRARQQYIEQARGPEKWVVLLEMSKDYKKLKDTFMKIKEYQQKFMQEQQKVQVAELRAEERTREVQQLCQQVKDMQKVHQETLHKMDQQCRDQIDKVKQEMNELQGFRDARSKMSVTVDDNFPVIEVGRLNFPAESYLGHGGFAAVVKGYHRDWKQDVAVKCLLPGKTEGSQQPLLYSEARKLNLGGRSTCIISLLGVCLNPNFAIVMPYMENGSLAGLLRDVDVPWALRWRMAHEISLGMTFLHCQDPQILHCDLKSENVLLDDDFHAKISDFGLSKWRTQSRIVTGTSPTGATITHAPPEFITDINLIPSTKFDVYSFGVLLWEIITRRKPYENAMNSALIKLAVRDGQRPDLRFVPTNVPDVDTVSQLMQRCWRQNPEDRPTFQECEDQLNDVREKFSKETFYAAIIYITATKACTK